MGAASSFRSTMERGGLRIAVGYFCRTSYLLLENSGSDWTHCGFKDVWRVTGNEKNASCNGKGRKVWEKPIWTLWLNLLSLLLLILWGDLDIPSHKVGSALLRGKRTWTCSFLSVLNMWLTEKLCGHFCSFWCYFPAFRRTHFPPSIFCRLFYLKNNNRWSEGHSCVGGYSCTITHLHPQEIEKTPGRDASHWKNGNFLVRKLQIASVPALKTGGGGGKPEEQSSMRKYHNRAQ